MKLLKALFLAAILGVGCSQLGAGEESYSKARSRLAASIGDYAVPIGERADPRIVRQVATVPRHLFVPQSQRAEAYNDYPLPIGEDQTISQPSLVALMTHLLRPKRGDVMLEVGTGSGYQAAILSGLVRHVYTIEIVGPLARQSARRLNELGYRNVTVRHGDGYAGWPAHAPFDGIIVTAGADHVPKPLIDQLKVGGRMVIPVGSTPEGQRLKLTTKDSRGKIRERVIIAVRFVPLTRDVRGMS
ncbi:MAG TPA: protein-L-isoaspartate(D-aspartate) O-methyltransferase [Sphingomicrobium sp.]|nr:protein-L-isoaspartate(D-aspartate) O-methyltransferase [Sphingomicrobium sp.]